MASLLATLCISLHISNSAFSGRCFLVLAPVTSWSYHYNFSFTLTASSLRLSRNIYSSLQHWITHCLASGACFEAQCKPPGLHSCCILHASKSSIMLSTKRFVVSFSSSQAHYYHSSNDFHLTGWLCIVKWFLEMQLPMWQSAQIFSSQSSFQVSLHLYTLSWS